MQRYREEKDKRAQERRGNERRGPAEMIRAVFSLRRSAPQIPQPSPPQRSPQPSQPSGLSRLPLAPQISRSSPPQRSPQPSQPSGLSRLPLAPQISRSSRPSRIRQARRSRLTLLALLILLALCLSGCGGSGKAGGSGDAPPGSFDPQYHGAEYHKDQASGNDSAAVDFSAAADGYFAVRGKSDSRLKVQAVCGENTYTYDMASDGTPSIFPLQCGDGTYTVRVMENVTGSKYAELYSTSAQVKLKDEYQPFLRPSDYVRYNQDSACCSQAAEISAKAGSSMDVVSGVYDYICDNIAYDEEKAANVQTGYMPDPDETLTSGKGICFDYAALAAAMLRSQGIPTKVIFGYVSPDDLYHAWNMFYTEETGWVTVDYEVDEDSWNRLDLTFSANGEDSDFIGDGSHYSEVYIY